MQDSSEVQTEMLDVFTDDSDLVAFLCETFDFDEVNTYLHDEGFSSASEEDLVYLTVNQQIFQRQDYVTCLPFFEGEYWHAIVGDYMKHGDFYRFACGEIDCGIQVPKIGTPVTQMSDFMANFIDRSQIVYLQLAKLGTYCAMRGRLVVFHERRYFLIRSTELISFITSKRVDKERIARFHRFYTSSTFSFAYGMEVYLKKQKMDDITELANVSSEQLYNGVVTGDFSLL